MKSSSSPAADKALLAEQEIKYICNLAEHCGKLAADMRAGVGVREKTEPHDLVTDADLAVSTLLLKELSKRFPKDFLISEEDVPEDIDTQNSRIWYIDPIDGTDNYVNGDGQYAVMIGLLHKGQPHFGCVHSPANKVTYFGGPAYGSWIREPGGEEEEFKLSDSGEIEMPIRLMMGNRDRKNFPWVAQLSGMKLVTAGSVGLKVARVIRGDADLFIHLSGKLKYWDTVGPIAIALAAGLEAGTLQQDEIPYPLADVKHPQTIIIGRRGSLKWARNTIANRLFNEQ